MGDDPPVRILESAFQRAVIEMAYDAGFDLVRWETDSRRSNPGPPDLLLLRAPTARWTARLIHAELKSATGTLRSGTFTKKGRYLPGQDDYRRVLEAIQRAAEGLGGFVPEYYLWRAGRTWRAQSAVMEEIRCVLWRGHEGVLG